jgi:hypothetical protein
MMGSDPSSPRLAQPREQAFELRGQRRLGPERRTGVRPSERDRGRVQEHAAQPERPHPGVVLAVAVLVVARDGMSRESRMDADLVGASGADGDFHERRNVTVMRDVLEVGERNLAGAMHAHDTLAALARMGQDRRIDRLAAEPPAPGHQRRVMLLHRALAQQRMCQPQGRPRSRDEQASAGVTIEPMHELEGFLRAQRTQRLDGAEREPRAAVHREACRFVEHQQARIFLDDRGAHGLEQPVRDPARRQVRRRRLTHGRQAHFVVRGQPVVRLLALPVDADLAPPKQAVDPAARHARKLAQQEIVEPLALRRGARPHPPRANRLISIHSHGDSLTC